MKLAVRYADGSKSTFEDAPFDRETINIETYINEYKTYISELAKKQVVALIFEVDYTPESIVA